jgi:hypothetical protein
MISMARSRVALANASALIDLLYRPAALAAWSNAAELYQPAVPVFSLLLGFSKKMPSVAAP